MVIEIAIYSYIILSIWSCAGVAAAQFWSDFEDIPHIQGQRSPRKMLEDVATASQPWNGGCMALEQLGGDAPCPRAMEKQQ